MVLQETPEGAARLGCAPLCFGCGLRFLDHLFALLGARDTVQDLIRRVLDTRAWAMELSRRLRSELAKGVTITQGAYSFKH
jgi:hypothetical protein